MGRKSKWKVVIPILLVFLVALLILAGTSGLLSSASSLSDDDLTTVRRGNLVRSVVATGSIVPVTMVELKSKAAGLIERLSVEEGTHVKAGDVLVQLDRVLLQAGLREASANHMAAIARLQEAGANVTSARTQKKKMVLDLRNLDDNVGYREKRFERFQRMSEERIISYSELEDVERDYHDAYLEREALKSELLMQDARIEGAEKAVSRVEAEVTQARAMVDRAEENLRYATVRSPIEGMVLKRHVEVGDAVSSIL